jgi:hypothetical protein
VGGDTVTVAQAGQAWNALDQSSRSLFLAGEDPRGEFVVALARRTIVEQEVERLGYIEQPGMITSMLARARSMMCLAMTDTLAARAGRALTPEDHSFFLENLGRIVWLSEITDQGAAPAGPEMLSVMGIDPGAGLAALGPGGTIEYLGSVYRLDSISEPDPEELAAAMEDTSGFSAAASDMMAGWRAAMLYDSLQAALWALEGPAYSRPAFEALAAGIAAGDDIAGTDTLIVLGPGCWTAAQMLLEIENQARISQVFPTDTAWLYDFAGTLATQTMVAARFRTENPAAAESILAEARRFALKASADSLFDDYVEDSVSVDQAMIDSAYQAAPPGIPEMRSVYAVLIEDDLAAGDFRSSIDGGTAGAAARGLGHFPFLSAGGADPHLTRPLTPAEVPGGLGEQVFALEPGDTLTWLGPVQLLPNTHWGAVRLVSVIPAHTASPEEAQPILEPQIRRRRIEDRLNRWLAGLEAGYGLTINESVLTELPEDISTWEGLD